MVMLALSELEVLLPIADNHPMNDTRLLEER